MTPTFTGRIAEWDSDKGCGWIETDGQRIFLHRREFAERRKRIEPGDLIRFRAGTGPNGKLCAQQAVHLHDGGRLGLFAGALFFALLVLPYLAIRRTPVPLRPGTIVIVAVLVNLLTFAAYASDKRKARNRQWRVSEATLHILELIGGWPAAFLAQRQLRHKCTKVSFQVVFWLIVLLWQLVALDLICHGGIYQWLKQPNVKPSIRARR